MNKKYLHLFYIDKFTLEFIDFVNNNFVSNDHLFLIFGKNYSSEFDGKSNVIRIKKNIAGLFLLLKKMMSYKKIIFHGLFDKRLILLLLFFPVIAKKGNWVIWGGDLYKDDNKINKDYIYDIIKKKVIKNIEGVITCLDGDYNLARKKYGFSGVYYKCIMYPSNLFRSSNFFDANFYSSIKKIILIGNSASFSNNHLEVFEKVEKFKNKNIEIVCPLSYGDNNYKKKVLLRGYEIFGNKFKPILKFLSKEDYMGLLEKVDIAIFNHKRNQAMGNIISLIGFGKKVYIRDDIAAWNFFNDLNIKTYSTNDLFDDLFENVPCDVIFSNICKAKEYFSERNLRFGWGNIFQLK